MSEDIKSFEYFEEMTTNWSRLDLLRRCYDLCNEMVEKQKEIERLNNIINELEDYMIGKDIYKILLYKLRDLKEVNK